MASLTRSTRWLFVLLATGMCITAGVAEAQDNLEEAAGSAIERGAEALEQEDYETARQAFTEAIEAIRFDPDPRGYIGRARALVGLELYQEALDDFKAAYDRTSGAAPEKQLMRAEVQYRRGKMYLDLGGQFIGSALPDLQAAYEANRDNLDYAFALGKAYAMVSQSMAGAAQQGERILSDYLEEYPDDAEALRLRGATYAAQRKMDEAKADLEASLELDPEDHEAYFALGTMYLQQEDYTESIAALRQSIEKYVPEEDLEDVPYMQGYLALAAAYEEMGKQASDDDERREAYAQTIATCDELLELLPDEQQYAGMQAAALFRKGVSHRLREEFGPAVKALTDAIDINPEMAEAYFRRAICFVEMGEERLALRDLEAAQALNFEDARAYLWEGMTYAQMGEYRDAIRAYNEAISFSNRYVDAYLNRGHAYFQLGEYENAIDSFNECIRLQPSRASYYYRRGLCYHNLEELEDAVKSYINAIEFDEDYVEAYDKLIAALELQGRQDLAEEYRAKRAEMTRQRA